MTAELRKKTAQRLFPHASKLVGKIVKYKYALVVYPKTRNWTTDEKRFIPSCTLFLITDMEVRGSQLEIAFLYQEVIYEMKINVTEVNLDRGVRNFVPIV